MCQEGGQRVHCQPAAVRSHYGSVEAGGGGRGTLCLSVCVFVFWCLVAIEMGEGRSDYNYMCDNLTGNVVLCVS